MPFSVRGWSAHWLLLLALSPLGLAVLAAGPLLCRADNPTALDPGKKIPEVTVETTGPDSFQATWKAILWAARYEVSFGTNPAASNRGTQFITTTAFSRGNLIAATTYYIKVRAIIGGRADAWSEVVAVTTQLPPITGLAVDDVSDTGMHLTWPGLYTGMADVFYEISLETNPAATARELQTTQQNTLSLSQLRPHTTYYLKIRLRRNLVTGPWSDPMPVATLTATSGPMVLAESEKAPLNLLEVTHTSVKAGWAEIPGAEAYELAYLPLTAPENQKPLSLKTHRPPVDLANLKPGLAYRVKLRPLFPTRGPGAWSSFLTFSTFPAPPAPNPLYLVQVTDTYVQLTWTAQEGIGTYEALVSTDALDEDGSRQIVHLGAARLEGLMENTRYWAKVRALSQGGPGVWSAPVTFISPLISAPKNLTPLHVTATESAVNWTRVPGNATTTYELRLAAEGEAWRTFPGLTAHNRSLNDLSPDTRYHVQVRAKNTTGYGPWSPETTLHTPIVPPNEAPTELLAENITDVSGKIVWKRLPQAVRYRLGIGSDMYASNRGDITVSEPEYELKGLIPETNYFARVKAVNAAGEGPWSEIVGFSTLPSPPVNAPEGVEIKAVTARSLILVWTPSADTLNYEVGYGTDLQNPTAEIKAVTACSYTLSDLNPGTFYTLRVRKLTRGGCGPWSQSRTVTTPAL